MSALGHVLGAVYRHAGLRSLRPVYFFENKNETASHEGEDGLACKVPRSGALKTKRGRPSRRPHKVIQRETLEVTPNTPLS